MLTKLKTACRTRSMITRLSVPLAYTLWKKQVSQVRTRMRSWVCGDAGIVMRVRMKWRSSALAVSRYWLSIPVTISIRFLYSENGLPMPRFLKETHKPKLYQMNRNNRTWCHKLIIHSRKFKAKANGSASTATFTTLVDQMNLAGIATSEIEKCLIL